VLVASAVVTLFPLGTSGGAPNTAANANFVQQEVQNIWHMPVWNIQLADHGVLEGIEDAQFANELARIATVGYKGFLKHVLPAELANDTDFAERYYADDTSRLNRAFLRWQKRVYAKTFRKPYNELNWDGSPMPFLPGVKYEWNSFYKSKIYADFIKHVKSLTRSYLSAATGAKDKGQEEDFMVMAWAEVYKTGAYQRPHTHTGAVCAGHFVVRYPESEGGKTQRLMFQDPRGINPPFGNSHWHDTVEGELVMWPSWAPHMLTPGNFSTIYISFLVWPEDGASDLDWEDDPLGDATETKASKVTKDAPGSARKGRAAQKEEL